MMKNLLRLALLSALLIGVVVSGTAQQSDFAIKKEFEETYKSLFDRIEFAKTIAQLDSLRAEVDSLHSRFAEHSELIDKVVYPESFEDRLRALRTLEGITYDRVYLVQTQGVKIEELETRILFLTSRLDTLTQDRERLLAELKSTKQSNTQLRRLVERLQANSLAKDRLIFALVDSIFLPYGGPSATMSDLQKEAINRKLEKSNVLTRIEEIASENASFLAVTQLQPKDYPSVFDQYRQFEGRWQGLRESITAAALAGSRYTTGDAKAIASKGKAGKPAAEIKAPGAKVDSLLGIWEGRFKTMLWGSIAKEFTDRQITLEPFSDGPTFATSVRSYVRKLSSTGEDPGPFVEEVWKARIDKEWRDVLAKPGILGQVEYAALDREISELQRPVIDGKFVLYAVIAIILAIVGWWLLARKKPSAEAKPKT